MALKALLVVMLGGALGSGARYLIATWTLARFGPNFPWGTVLVNVLGSFALGCVMQFATLPAASGSGGMHPDVRVFLTTGVLGGFTTYSTFNYDTLHLVQAGSVGLATANVVGTVITCLVAGFAGIGLARLLAAG